MATGHVFYGVHEHIPQPTEYITVLREPIARVVSMYNHVLRRPEHRCTTRSRVGDGLQEFARSCADAIGADNVTAIVEFPPAGTLAGIAKRELRGVPTHAVKSPADLDGLAELSGNPGVQPHIRRISAISTNQEGATVPATQEEIIAGLAEIIEEVTGIEPSEVTPEKSFVDDLDIDSLSMVEIAVQTEDKYGVKIPDEDLAGLRTVGDVVGYIQKLEEENPEAAAAIRAQISESK